MCRLSSWHLASKPQLSTTSRNWQYTISPYTILQTRKQNAIFGMKEREDLQHMSASCVTNYLEKRLKYDDYILYSDGCGYQNRNCVLSNALSRFAQTHQKTVTQKILERGHTQMEVDSVHATIERKLQHRHVDIYCPADYVSYIKEARKVPEPYNVQYLDHTFFKDFTGVGVLKSIRPGSRAGDPTVAHLRALKYSRDGNVHYKLRHPEEWEELPKPRVRRVHHEEPHNGLPRLYTEKRPIAENKLSAFRNSSQ